MNGLLQYSQCEETDQGPRENEQPATLLVSKSQQPVASHDNETKLTGLIHTQYQLQQLHHAIIRCALQLVLASIISFVP